MESQEQTKALVNPEREDVTNLIYPELSFETEETQSVMEVDERKRRLSRFARENILTPSGRPHRAHNVESIKELNKMEGSYAPLRHQHQHVVFNVRLVDRKRDSEIIESLGEEVADAPHNMYSAPQT